MTPLASDQDHVFFVWMIELDPFVLAGMASLGGSPFEHLADVANEVENHGRALAGFPATRNESRKATSKILTTVDVVDGGR